MSPLFCCLYSEPSQSSLDSSHRPTKICTPAPVCSIVPSLLCKAFQTIQLFVTDSSVHFYHVGTLEYLTLYIFNMLQITKLKWFACILAVHMLDSLQIINLSAIQWCMLHVHIYFMSQSQSSRLFFLLLQIYCKGPVTWNLSPSMTKYWSNKFNLPSCAEMFDQTLQTCSWNVVTQLELCLCHQSTFVQAALANSLNLTNLIADDVSISVFRGSDKDQDARFSH